LTQVREAFPPEPSLILKPDHNGKDRSSVVATKGTDREDLGVLFARYARAMVDEALGARYWSSWTTPIYWTTGQRSSCSSWP